MNYVYLCQKHAEERKNKIVKIPVSTKIADEYLCGLDNSDFIKIFSNLQDIAISVYRDMINDPEGYGLKMLPITAGSVNLVSCFGNVLYAFGKFGKLNDTELIINLDSYKREVKKHKYNKIQSKLQDFGFIIKEFNGKSFEKGITDFSISYPDNPNMITVIKAFSEAVKPYIDNATTDKYYIDDIFNLFTYRPLEDKTKQKHETMFLMMTDYYNESVRNILYSFHEKIKYIGFKYESLYGSLGYLKNGSRRISFGYGSTADNINMRIIFNNIDKIIDIVKSSSPNIKNPFYSSSCHFCGGQSNFEKPCPKRTVHEIDGQTFYNCKMVSFVFNDIQKEDLDVLVKLIKIEYNL